MHWSNDYVGIPFRWNSYSRDGAFCYSLVWLVQTEVFGRDLPRHDDISRAVSDGVGGTPPERWMQGIEITEIAMTDAAEGDVLQMWGIHGGKRTPRHVGVFVDGCRVLHTEAGTGALIEDVRAGRAAWRPIRALRLT